jgi:hypothetical protein
MKTIKNLNKIVILGISFIVSGCISSKLEMSTQLVNIPLTHSSLQIIHSEKHTTGGFSTLSFSPDCSYLTTISDYSQVNDSKLDQPVRRSGWYQFQVYFNKNKALNKLELKQKGQLKDLDGSIMLGATESMAKEKNGYLVSFDDRGSIYRYSASKNQPNPLSNIPTIAYQQTNLGDGNLGLESIARLKNGDLLALWETKMDDSNSHGRLLKVNGEQIDIQFNAAASPGGATRLQDGSLLILEKRWLGNKGQRLRLVNINENDLTSENLKISKGIIKGKTLLDDISKHYDNNEGISSCVSNGKEWIFVITDDNGDWPSKNLEVKDKERQRTLLMQYSLEVLTDDFKIK